MHFFLNIYQIRRICSLIAAILLPVYRVFGQEFEFLCAWKGSTQHEDRRLRGNFRFKLRRIFRFHLFAQRIIPPHMNFSHPHTVFNFSTQYCTLPRTFVSGPRMRAPVFEGANASWGQTRPSARQSRRKCGSEPDKGFLATKPRDLERFIDSYRQAPS